MLCDNVKNAPKFVFSQNLDMGTHSRRSLRPGLVKDYPSPLLIIGAYYGASAFGTPSILTTD